MNITSRLHSLFTDDRFDSNLIAVYGVIVTAIVLSLILRRKLGASSPSQLFHWPGLHWLNALTDHAHRHARRVLFWLTAGFIVFVAFAGVAYHAAGHDIRTDLGDCAVRGAGAGKVCGAEFNEQDVEGEDQQHGEWDRQQ